MSQRHEVQHITNQGKHGANHPCRPMIPATRTARLGSTEHCVPEQVASIPFHSPAITTR